jgi:hypothetical protein
MLIIMTYFMFAKDYVSVAQFMLILKQFPELKILPNIMIYGVLRTIAIILNEFVVFWLIASTNLGEEGGLGLIINFSAAVVVSEFDDIIVKTGRVIKAWEYFNKDNQNLDEREIDLLFEHLNQPRFKKTEFLKLNVSNKLDIAKNGLNIPLCCYP